MKKQNQFSFWKKNKTLAKTVTAFSLFAMVFSLNVLPLTASYAHAEEVSESSSVSESVSVSESTSVSDSSSNSSENSVEGGEESSSEVSQNSNESLNNNANGSANVNVNGNSGSSVKVETKTNTSTDTETSTSGNGSASAKSSATASVNVSVNSSVAEDDSDVSPECRPADFDENGVVDTRDILAFFNAWRDEGDPKHDSTDLNANGSADQGDVLAFLDIWEDCSTDAPQMCFAPVRGGGAADLGNENLQNILNTYTNGNNEDPIDAVEDQKNYEAWEATVSGELGSSGLTCAEADWDGNGEIDTRDIIDFLNDWNAEAPETNLNNDQTIDAIDFYVFLKLWKTCYAGDEVQLDGGEMEVELIAHEASNPMVFGYYTNGDLENFTPVFKVGNHTDYPSVPLLNMGGEKDFTVPYFADDMFTEEVGFAVDIQGNGTYTFATDRSLNSGTDAQILVYDFVQGEYILALEDVVYSNSDKDFDDLVVRVTAKSCDGDGGDGGDGDELTAPVLVSPTNEAYVNGSVLESIWNAVSGAVEYLYQRLSNPQGDNDDVEFATTTSETSLTQEDLEEQVYWWRVKALGEDGEESDWSETWKVTIDNTAPVSNDSLVSGSSFEGSINVSGSTTDNWNVRSIVFSQAVSSGATCGEFSQVSTKTLDHNSSSTIEWNHSFELSEAGTYCLKAEGVDYAGNKEVGTAAVNISFTPDEDDNGGGDGGNGDDDGNGGGGGSNNDDDDDGGSSSGGGRWRGGGRVLGASTEDLSDLEAQLEAARQLLLTLLNQRLYDLQSQLANLTGDPSLGPQFAGGVGGGQVLGVAQAQDFEGEALDEEVEELDEATTTLDADDEDNEISPDETNWGRILLWILFIIIILVLLWLAFRKKKTTTT